MKHHFTILGSLKSRAHSGQGGVLTKIECSGFHYGPGSVSEAFLAVRVRVNSVETGMLRAPDYKDYPAEFIGPFLSLNGTESCVVTVAAAM